ncbi:MAG TPA: hypothetical protein VLC55_09010 [Burkholderiales bacterium]|nr:hypothetical protein [Burkholderiales bacterium]
MPGDLFADVEFRELLSILALVGVMYAIVIAGMLLLVEPRPGVALPRCLRLAIARLFGALRSLR